MRPSLRVVARVAGAAERVALHPPRAQRRVQAPGRARANESALIAEKVWEPKFLGEIIAGRDSRVSPSKPKREGVVTVAAFLDEYFTNYVDAEGLKSMVTVRGHIKQLKEALGHLAVTALEKPPDIARFKALYRKGRTLATVNRALGVLRAAINWGRFQDPPLLSSSPFHRFGISIKRRDENKRDRRVHRDEEQQLLAACLTMNAGEHKWTGPAMHDRIIGALETCCRQGEMLRIQNKDVDWAQGQIIIRGANAKDSENRRIPFDLHGRLAPILKRRATLGPQAFVFGSPDGQFAASLNGLGVESGRREPAERRRTRSRRVETTGNNRGPLRIVSRLSVGLSSH